MNITVVACAYNEKKYISYMVDYYKEQGCNLLIAENYSDDGTHEWLVENNIPHIRVDTEESFHINRMQVAILEKLKEISPDWLIYTGVDTFFIFPDKISEKIEKTDKEGYNTIQTRLVEVYNTGEKFSVPLHHNYFYGEHKDLREMIVKYHPDLKILADRLIVPEKKTLSTTGILVNYGMCKPKEERETTLERRERAWKLGLSKTFGTHYKKAKEHQWVWSKEKLKDIRTFNEWENIKRHLHL